MRLPKRFYAQPTISVARALLGQRLVRVASGERLSGLILETEAYGGPDDLASHARRRTLRSAIMYGPPGYAYVYFIYGCHHCLNAVTAKEGRPGAVLIRAILPQEGLVMMRANRGGALDSRLADGPGKLCQALQITIALNGVSLCDSTELFIEQADAPPPRQIVAAPRIGVRGDALALERPWRFTWKP